MKNASFKCQHVILKMYNKAAAFKMPLTGYCGLIGILVGATAFSRMTLSRVAFIRRVAIILQDSIH
jgi:hypothetical protein